jgi:hypothetical protein
MSYDVSKRPADYATRRAGAHERELLLLIGLVFLVGCTPLLLWVTGTISGTVTAVLSLAAIAVAFGLERGLANRFDLFERWTKGARSEAAVGAELEQLRPEFVVMHDIERPGAGNIDHLVSGPTGVFLVETKHRRFEKPQLRKVRGQAAAIHDSLGEWVTPVICLDRPFRPRVYGGVTVVGRPEIVAWIRGQRNRSVPFDALARFSDGVS